MFKKFFVICATLSTLIFLWTINSVPIFGEESMINEVYCGLNSSSNIIFYKEMGFAFNFNRYGEAVVLDSNFDYNLFLQESNATIQFYEQLDSGLSIYAYSDSIKYKAKVKGEKVNIHIHISDENIKIGFPIIFGSF